jgi:hypothetical protein
MKQAIREVLLSDEFMTAFAAAFCSATVPRLTLEHPIPGVNRPMRSEAQLSKMVELDMDNLITLCREHHFRIGHDPSGGWEPTKDEIEYAMDRCGVPASEPINPSESPNSSSKPTPKPSKTQPPSGYRMLGPAKDEPRQASDLYWSLSAKNWIPIKLNQVEYANRDDWVACRKIKVTSPPQKRYREPTLADLANGPIACGYRDDEDEQWKSGLLVYVLDGVYPFLCVNKERIIAVQWRQCQIEVTE